MKRSLLQGFSRIDLVLVGLLSVTAVIEGATREAIVWPVFTTVFALASIGATLWRRRYPFAMVVAAFGGQLLVRMVASGLDVPWRTPWSMVILVTLPYALLKRATPSQCVVGLLVLLLFPARIALAGDLGSAFGATIVLVAPAFLGLAARLRDVQQLRLRECAVQEERETMAREIHDTVAHRLAAIAVQVQAAKLDGEGGETLEVIEEQSARALSELRAIVRGLRNASEPSALDAEGHDRPLPGIAEIHELAGESGLPVQVTITGDTASVDATTAAAVYRIARESLTNVLRHARAPREVAIDIGVANGRISLVVSDDGSRVSERTSDGFGLVGMEERAALLGGTLAAGPGPEGGWTVRATLPIGGAR